eukprot:878022_1
MPACFTITVVVTIIHLQCLYHVTSQWQQIWYDSLSSGTNWNMYEGGGIIDFGGGTGSSSCPSSSCTTMKSDGATTYFNRDTSVSSYGSLQIEISVSTRNMDTGDYCEVWYSYNGGSLYLADRWNGPSSGDRKEYWHQTVTLPDASSASTVRLRYEVDGPDKSWCYWDEAYLYGITATPQPTPKPTPKPTTKNPTPDPTKRPTTKNPSPSPTKRPTPNPTKPPTPKATTKMPTPNPTKKPTTNPTKRPSLNPTPRPTNPPDATCGSSVSGSYHGDPVTFLVNLPYEGDIVFNAGGSTFVVTDIEAFTKLNMPLGTDNDH